MTAAANLGRFVLSAAGFGGADARGADRAGVPASTLAATADAVAAQLRAVPATADEPVVLLVSGTPQDLAGFIGIWLAGCVAVPIHAAAPDVVRAALVARTGARLAVRAARLETTGVAPPPRRPLLRGAALVVFTSGSTGEPKGVVIGHDGMIFKLRVLDRLLGLTPDDVVALPLPLTFIFGIWVALLSLVTGARLVLAPKLSAVPAGTTALAAVPTLLRTLCAGEATFAAGLRIVLTGGEPFAPALADTLAAVLPATAVVDLYGLTETGACDFCARPHDQPAARGSIGRPTEGVSFRIVALAELGLPPGTGELQIKTPARMLGYLDDPAQTAAALSDGHVRTGDLATCDGFGFVRLAGRSKDIISRGGNKIAPLEIENLFAQHPGVAAVLAFGVADERLGEKLHAMVVARRPDLTEPALRAWARTRLERFKTPDVFHFVDALPSGRTGKADRAAARASLAGRGT